MATVSIVDTDRVWSKASLGLVGVRHVTRDPGLCASVILQGTPYVVSNARTDPRTTAHPLVTGDLGLQIAIGDDLRTGNGSLVVWFALDRFGYAVGHEEACRAGGRDLAGDWRGGGRPARLLWRLTAELRGSVDGSLTGTDPRVIQYLPPRTVLAVVVIRSREDGHRSSGPQILCFAFGCGPTVDVI